MKRLMQPCAVLLVAAAMLALGADLAAQCNPGNQGNPGVIPPHAKVHGKSYAQWGFKWWQWAFSIPLATNPIFDTTGANAAIGQHGPVWFLAGTSGGPHVVRTVTIPHGKKIFFPIINTIVDYPCPSGFGFEPPPGMSLEAFLTGFAAQIMDYPGLLQVEVDGVPLQNTANYRATSRMHNFVADTSLQVWDPCIIGTPQPGVSDGYWIMLHPLSTGQHTIHVHASTVPPSLFVFETEFTFLITIT